jgi:phosphate transport system protein
VNRKTFDQQLNELHMDIIRMGSLIENAIENSIAAFKNEDKDLARSIMERDREINILEKQIESRCLSLIVRQQPVAADLRKISAALKLITDMERIGDNASDIAELTLRIRGEHIYTMVEHIPPMATIAVEMVRGAITSFVHSDLQKAKEIEQRDDEVDELFNLVKNELVNILKEKKEECYDNAIDFLMIAKYLERIGDHAVNICEWVEFQKTGEHKHIKIMG